VTTSSISTEDVNIASFFTLVTPDEMRKKLPITPGAAETVFTSRQIVANIIAKRDPRKFIIMGPCSIHDPISALEYAQLVKELSNEVKDKFLLIMRAYFEKPRTTVGWKGLINDPALDNSFNINEGLSIARKLLIDITSSGVPVGTESLEPISPQYIAELISWTAIGARTTESQTHRELASGLSSPVGFKNNTDGNIEVAINAIKSAGRPHHFLGIDHLGRTSIVATKGNPHCHLILRGGKERPNYDTVSVSQALDDLKKAQITDSLVIDCSHDNSFKDFNKQPDVFFECMHQILRGNSGIVGLMLESHLYEGSQSLSNNLRYGVSITDGCISFDKTAEIIRQAYREFTLPKNG